MRSVTVPPLAGVDVDDFFAGVVGLDEPHAAIATAETSTDSAVSTEVLCAFTNPPQNFDSPLERHLFTNRAGL
jgi:hypothetical protein